MNIKRNIIFSLEARKRDGEIITDNVPIRMRVSYSRNRVEFSTGCRIDAPDWDIEKQRVRNKSTNKLGQTTAELNADINCCYNIIQGIFKEFEVRGKNPTTEELKDIFSIRYGVRANTQQAEFMAAFDEFIRDESSLSNWAPSTHTMFGVVKKHLQSFGRRLSFEGFDEAKLVEYTVYLRDVKHMRNTTISRQIGFLKWFLRWAIKKGYTDNRAFEGFKPKLKIIPKKVVFLSWDELVRLRNCTLPPQKQYLDRVRDVFLFSCFTSLRYSDVFNLKRSDIKGGHIEITTMKTSDSLVIELNDHSRAILDKYKNVDLEGDKVLPVISNQKMNEYLKELCQLAGIDDPVHETYYKGNERVDRIVPKYQLIGTHTGRRTFICNALALGIPAQVVMKWTGHSDYKAMQPYIDIADDIKASAMSKFNTL